MNGRKKGLFWITIGLMLMMVAVCAVPAGAATVANWKFNERSGSAIVDSSGYGNNGTMYNATWTTSTSKSGSALSFNGTSSYISIPNSTVLNFSSTQSFTISAWVYIPAKQNRWQGLVTKGSYAETYDWYGIWISGDNKWVFGAGDNNIFGSDITTGWSHVAAVQNGATGTRYLYVNGVQVASGAASNGVTTSPLWIGGCKAINEYFTGNLDEVYVYNTVRTNAQISDEYNKYRSARIGYWAMNEPAADYDNTSYGTLVGNTMSSAYLNGTLLSSAGTDWCWTAGQSKTGLRFMREYSDRVEVPADWRLDYSLDDSFTLSAWVNVPTNQNLWQAIITKGRGTSSLSWYGIWISSDNRWVYGGSNFDNLFGCSVTPGWHHIALVQNGPARTRYLYVDAALQGSAASIDATAGAKLIFAGCEGVSENFSGNIDEVGLYNYALSSSSISSLYSSINTPVLNVQTYTQQPYSNLCWATSTSMVISYFLNDINNRKVVIAQDKYGTTDFNRGASREDSEHYVEYYTGRPGTVLAYAISFADCQTEINNKTPTIVRIGWKSGNSGHQLVLRGYYSSSSTSYIYINDPWDGLLHLYDYSYFLSNTEFDWTHTVVFD